MSSNRALNKKLKPDVVETKEVNVISTKCVNGKLVFEVMIGNKKLLLSKKEFKTRYTKDYARYLGSKVDFK